MFNTFTGRAARMTDRGVDIAAARIGIGRAELLAVIQVETGGRGFQRDGKLKMLFEPHLFYAAIGKLKNPALLTRAVQAGVAYKKWGEKPYPVDSYARLGLAMAIDETAALQSASWGLPQIIGSNYGMAGYGSAKGMIAAFVDSEDVQLVALADFLKAAGLVPALEAHDWARVARGYNGPAYAKNSYDAHLAAAYNKQKTIRPINTFVGENNDSPGIEPEPTPSPATGVPFATQTGETSGTATPVAGTAETTETSIADDALPETVESVLPAIGVSTETTLFVQQQLEVLGYHFVGRADGDSPGGGWTEAAILDFRNAYNKAHPELTPLPLVPTIDDDLLLALAKGPRKVISDSRANATAATLGDHPGIVNAARSKIGAAVLGAPAAAVAFGQGVIGNISSVSDYFAPVKALVGEVPTWVWALLVFAVAAGIYVTAHLSEARQVENVKTGKTA